MLTGTFTTMKETNLYNININKSQFTHSTINESENRTRILFYDGANKVCSITIYLKQNDNRFRSSTITDLFPWVDFYLISEWYSHHNAHQTRDLVRCF